LESPLGCRLCLCSKYEKTFRDNAIDIEVLPELTEADLEKARRASRPPRKRMLKAIAAGAPPAPQSAQTPRSQGAERRQLTVMFSDLVSSTALSTRLDPEDLREVLAAYHACVAETVAGFDGFVAKYMGDGVLVYFGYPRAQEDSAERAIRAGLAIVNRIARLDLDCGKLEVRIGIATGLVVVGDLIGDGPSQERGVVGETPNLAARLQGLAEPNTVMIADSTRRLVGALFEYRGLGQVQVRGLSEPVLLWQVLRPGTIQSRFEALRAASLTPLVGREDELEFVAAPLGSGQGGRRPDCAALGRGWHREIPDCSGFTGAGSP
jgi:class 3 adenylate cyclase